MQNNYLNITLTSRRRRRSAVRRPVPTPPTQHSMFAI